MCAFNTAMSAQQHLDKPDGAQGEPGLAEGDPATQNRLISGRALARPPRWSFGT
jgi:hypothetical protein